MRRRTNARQARGRQKPEAKRRKPGERLIVVSNRLPYAFRRGGDGRMRAEPASGGLVTALRPVLRDRGGVWIGWGGTTVPVREIAASLNAASAEAGYTLAAVPLAADQVRDFYLGFSNEIVWPLFHDMPSVCNFEPRYWRTYCAVNAQYARAVHAAAEASDLVWVHDYHLMNVAEELRALGNRSRLAFFLHIPFPPPDLFFKLPWRRALLRALLRYDLVGLQTVRDRRNFVACVRAMAPEVRLAGKGNVVRARSVSGVTHIGSFPISIDYAAFRRRAAEPDVADKAAELHRLLPRRKIVLGVDRLDYTKGIPERLRAFQHLLGRYPEMRGRVSLIQVVVPSREDIPQYHQLRNEIERLVGEINGAYARPGGWVPVWYEYRSLSRIELFAYYRAADIALVTPLKDGMNLVAKEYCACSIEEDCVLILSEFAGAAQQLKGALLVNPFDVEGVAEAIREACEMPASRRAARMRQMRRSIQRQDVYAWVDGFLREAVRQGGAAYPRLRSPGTVDAEEQLPL
ncbi:MAG TPA: trehalose-6-phosphate synthase [Burkholderiales bacterium]|nr:trehalose-6-phosphate synthase [Burkholderiales bacterium]